MWTLKYEINEFINERETELQTEKRLEVAEWEGRWGKAGLEV